MPTLTIRNVDEEIMTKLKEQAQAHNRSVEAEVRQILAEKVTRVWRGAELVARAERVAAMTPKGVKQTDSALLIREDRDR